MHVKFCIKRAVGLSGIDDLKIQTERVERRPLLHRPSALIIIPKHSSTSVYVW